MTKKGAVFKWTKEWDTAFKLLKVKTHGGASAHKPTGKQRLRNTL